LDNKTILERAIKLEIANMVSIVVVPKIKVITKTTSIIPADRTNSLSVKKPNPSGTKKFQL
tara:strand:+ start:114 stop:296 length:183 start_codon:yes stop_codon:yes gene_type:complete